MRSAQRRKGVSQSLPMRDKRTINTEATIGPTITTTINIDIEKTDTTVEERTGEEIDMITGMIGDQEVVKGTKTIITMIGEGVEMREMNLVRKEGVL